MKVVEKVDRNFWEDVAGRSSSATFFHTPLWSSLMEKTFSCVDITKGFIFENGTRVVFPFVRYKQGIFHGFLNDYISGLLYVYGGPISDKSLDKQQYNEIIEYIDHTFKKYSRILIRGNPYCKPIETFGYRGVIDCSHLVELYKYGKEEDLFRIYDKRGRRHIQREISSGRLSITKSISSSEYEKLYQLYRKSFRYWGRKIMTNYPLALFQNLYKIRSNHIEFWTVYYKNKMIGGEFFLLWNNNCMEFCPYFDRDYSRFHARRFLLHNIFVRYKEKGIRYFDFLQSGGTKGVEDFKRSMGGQMYYHKAWIKESRFLRAARYAKKCLRLFFK